MRILVLAHALRVGGGRVTCMNILDSLKRIDEANEYGLVVPSKLYGVLQTEAPVLFIGPRDADTAQESQRYHAGETIEETSTGDEVVAALDRLYTLSVAGNAARTVPDNTGPERIAEFVPQ